MDLISAGSYSVVWDRHMSNNFKSTMTRDSFLANLSIGRQMFGALVDGKLIDMSFAPNEPAKGYQGAVYAFNFVNTYKSVKLYERVVVINEDGQGFKLAGFFANPAQ